MKVAKWPLKHVTDQSIPLNADDPHAPHAHHADETDKQHPAEHDPEGGPVPGHESPGRGLVGVRRAGRHGRGDDLGHAQPDGAAELGARVEDGSAEGLRMAGEDVGDDEQADGEEQVAADRGEDLFGKKPYASATWNRVEWRGLAGVEMCSERVGLIFRCGGLIDCLPVRRRHFPSTADRPG